MKWPLTSTRKVDRLKKEIQDLREKMDRAKLQRDDARTQRDRVKARIRTIGRDDSGSSDVIRDLTGRLVKMTEECNLFRHLHDTLRAELEASEANTMAGVYDPPMPPSDLRFRIGGQRSIWLFLRIGETVVADLQRLIQEAGQVTSEFNSILDFGAGCGRVLRHLPGAFPEAQIHAADVDAEAMSWCSKNLPFLTSNSVLPLLPPSTLGDKQFDLIYAISVFTHLPLTVQTAWFAELKRVAKPGALLVLSYLPDSAAAEHFTPNMAIENVDGFSYYKTTPTEGLPDYYHVSYHTEEAIRRLAGEYFDVLFTREKGINNHQNVIVCKV